MEYIEGGAYEPYCTVTSVSKMSADDFADAVCLCARIAGCVIGGIGIINAVQEAVKEIIAKKVANAVLKTIGGFLIGEIIEDGLKSFFYNKIDPLDGKKDGYYTETTTYYFFN